MSNITFEQFAGTDGYIASRALLDAVNCSVALERPLLIKGVRTWGKTRTEIVIGEQSAKKVIALGKTDFFSHAGVIIVLD